jgi:homoserine trans-succinylase
MIPSSIHI